MPSVIASTTPGSLLELQLQRVPEDIFEPDYAALPPMVRLTAYLTHQRVFGWLHLGAGRLTDLLNAHEEFRLGDVEIEDFKTGETNAVDEVLIGRDELIAVVAGDPPGDRALRRPTWTHPISLRSGNYLAGGYLHVTPGDDPVADFTGRPPMVPLTFAWLEYWSGDRRSIQSIGTIVLNRNRVDTVRVITDDDLIDGSAGRFHRAQ